MNNIRVLLSEPEGAVNLGFIARAMANTGFSDLHISGKLCPTHASAMKYALAAGNILESSVRHPDFESLVSSCDKIIGISMRTPATAGMNLDLAKLKERINFHRAKNLSVGLLFGNEKRGLSNNQLALCERYVSLDTSDVFPSMNLAQAVLVVLWVIKDITPPQPENIIYADRNLMEALNKKIKLFLDTFGCLNEQNPEKIRNEILRMTESKTLTEREAVLILSALGKAVAQYETVRRKKKETD